MAVTPRLMNLLVCRSKRAHLPGSPQLLQRREQAETLRSVKTHTKKHPGRNFLRPEK